MSKENWILIPVHNRREITLRCLANLDSVGVFESCHVLVIDDGSSDGTAQSICSEFPNVKLLHGDGLLYWTGAIEMGMRYAMDLGAECILWLNDDSVIPAGGIEKLVEVCRETKGIASAQTFVNMHTIGEKFIFPSKYKGKSEIINKTVISREQIVSVDACRGNLVAIHRSVVAAIGYPNGQKIPHALGDADYTLRASSRGIPCNLVTDVLLEELGTKRSDNDSWLLGEKSVVALWSDVFSKRSSLYPPMRWIYLTTHWKGRGMLQFPLPYLKLGVISLIRILLPRKLLISLYGNRSHAWKATAWNRSDSGDK